MGVRRCEVREHQTSGRPLCLPGWACCYSACRWSAFEPWVCHWPSFLRHVVLLHKPSARTVGHLEELEGDQSIQERGVSAAEEPRREGCPVAPSCSWCRAHNLEQGASRLHRRKDRGSIQERHIPLLISSSDHSSASLASDPLCMIVVPGVD